MWLPLLPPENLRKKSQEANSYRVSTMGFIFFTRKNSESDILLMDYQYLDMFDASTGTLMADHQVNQSPPGALKRRHDSSMAWSFPLVRWLSW